jgi:hypothetical protein
MRTLNSDQLWLATHVRACACDGQIILLDLRSSAYLGIDEAQCGALADRVGCWPRSPDSVRARTTSEGADRTVSRLMERGLLTDSPLKQPSHATVEEATSSLDIERSSRDPCIGSRRLTSFILTAVQTTWWMRCRSLHAITSAVQARRDRLQSHSASCSLDSIQAGTAAYERLRPFALSAHRNCLHDSLALVGFLASEGAFPRWVVGVKTRPFGAHSWVQMGTTVLNDQHETVRQFRPILVV